MNFLGKEAIARATRTTGRTLLFLSFLLGLASISWIDIGQNSLLGLQVQPDKFIPLLKITCGLSAVAHIVQWYSDYVSYKGWNVTGKMPGGSRYGASSKTKLRDLVDEINGLQKKQQNNLQERVKRLERMIEEIDWSMKRFDCFAKFYVFGWHLALPLAAACLAFILACHA